MFALHTCIQTSVYQSANKWNKLLSFWLNHRIYNFLTTYMYTSYLIRNHIISNELCLHSKWNNISNLQMICWFLPCWQVQSFLKRYWHHPMSASLSFRRHPSQEPLALSPMGCKLQSIEKIIKNRVIWRTCIHSKYIFLMCNWLEYDDGDQELC